MIYVRIGSRIVRSKELRIDTIRQLREEDGPYIEKPEDREARVEQKLREIQEELKQVKPNKYGLI